MKRFLAFMLFVGIIAYVCNDGLTNASGAITSKKLEQLQLENM